jgi:hypothetical protein
MGFWTILAIVIAVLIVIFWITHYLYKNGKIPDGAFKDSYENMIVRANYTYDKYFSSPIQLYNQTIGYQNDDVAQLALEKALKKEEAYEKNEKRGKISRKGAKDAAINAFIIANLYRFNVAADKGNNTKERQKARQNAALFFVKAINRVNNNPNVFIDEQKPVDPTQPKQLDTAIPPEFIIERAEDFYEDYLQQLQELGLSIDDIQEVPIPNFDRVRDAVRQARVKAARPSNGALLRPAAKKDATLKTYYDNRPITSDPQNIHDSTVQNDVRNIFSRILQKNMDDEMALGSHYRKFTLRDIHDAIQQHNFRTQELRDRALTLYGFMSQHNEVMNLNSTEDEVLMAVWQRIHSPENESKQQALKSAFMDALANGFDVNNEGKFKEVCVNGRCNRLLNSLTLLDEDPNISKPVKTTEILRNEVFSKSYKIIQDELDRAAPEVAAAYRGESPAPGSLADPELPKKVSDFENHLKDTIATTLRNDYADSKPEILENLIKDAQAGVGV